MGADRSRRSAGIAIVASVFVPLTMVGGCSLFTSIDGLTSGDAADSATCSTCDAGLDVDVGGDGDAPDDGSTVIDDASEAGDGSIPPGAFVCGTGTVDNCSHCAGAHQPCVTCDNSGATSPPFCVKSGDNCRDDLPSDLSSFNNGCDCSGGPSTCPEAYQVCHSSMFCHTCGEPMSDGEPCQEGGTCSGIMCN